MTVWIVNYRGTIYGVFDSLKKASVFADRAFGVNNLDVNVSDYKVE